jgi:hypothetical protein
MCDYSLHTNPNRLAKDDEDLVVHRFPTGSLGLASPDDLKPKVVAETGKTKSMWATIRSWFEEQRASSTPVCAVCIPPGARLIVSNMPQDLQRELGVPETDEVSFTQISANAHSYRDAIRFKNGRQVLLQALREGQRVHVVSLALAEVEERREARAEVVYP